MQLNVDGWAASDIGRRRERNEDRYFCDPAKGVFAVADGVGGKPGGAEASKMVVEQLEERAAEVRRFVDERAVPLDDRSRDEIFEFLTGAVQEINRKVYQKKSPSTYPRGIGSTLDMVVLAAQGAFVLHVGDSRVYLLRGEDIYRITRDHTYEEHIRQNPHLLSGDQTPGEYSHVLTRSIGGRPRVRVDRVFVELKPGDQLLLCTDGITNEVDGAEIQRLFGDEPPRRQTAQKLVDLANERGGRDNATAVVVQVDSSAETGDDGIGFSRATTRRDTFWRVRFLESVEMFSELNFQELLRVLRFVHTRSVTAGETIVRRGDPVDGLYFVMEGQLSVQIESAELTRLGEGEHFGEFALFGEPVRSADVHAECDGELLFISRENVDRLIEQTPGLGIKLLRKMLERTSQIIQSMLGYTPHRRQRTTNNE